MAPPWRLSNGVFS